VEIPCRYTIKDSSNEAYIKANNTGRFKLNGNIEFSVFQKHLDELVPEGIKYGDYISVPINETLQACYVITDAGERPTGNAFTYFGTTNYFRKFKGAEVDPQEFNVAE
jgi:hypothetical protein